MRRPLRPQGRWKMAKLVSEEFRKDGSIHRAYVLTKEEAEAAKVESMGEDMLRLRVLTEPAPSDWTSYTTGEPRILYRRRRE